MTQKPGYIDPKSVSEADRITVQTPQSDAEVTRSPGYAAQSTSASLKEPPPELSGSTSAQDHATEDLNPLKAQGIDNIGKSVIAVISVLLLLMLTNELVLLWQSHWLLGVMGSGVLSVVLLGVLNVWRQERRATQEVNRLKAEQEAVQQALKRNELSALKTALIPWLDRQSKTAPQLIQRFKDAAVERTTAEEYWQLYQLMVLDALDQQAQKIIRHYTLTTGTAVMVIPHAGLDTLVVLWRSRIMTREIAAVYGLETTSLSAFKLFKQALITVMVVAGVETLAQEKLLSEGSDELMNRILGGVSQSLITARRTYKLGRLIQLACQPYGEKR